MARSLKGVTFFSNSNNGVIALIREDLHRNNEKVSAVNLTLAITKLGQQKNGIFDALAHVPQKPVFTFASVERVANHPWFTASNEMWDPLVWHINREGGAVTRHQGVWVPFSNGSEVGLNGVDAQRDELFYVTSEQDFVEMFGVAPEQLLRNYKEHMQS